MRQLILTGMFGLGLLGLTEAATAQQGGTNSVTSEAWFGQPNQPKRGFIRLTYYGKWSVDAKAWIGVGGETDLVELKKGQWVRIQGTDMKQGLQVDARSRLNDFGIYGLPQGGNPPPDLRYVDLPYAKGGVVNVRAQLFAKNGPNAQPISVSTAIQTLTMP